MNIIPKDYSQLFFTLLKQSMTVSWKKLKGLLQEDPINENYVKGYTLNGIDSKSQKLELMFLNTIIRMHTSTMKCIQIEVKNMPLDA